MSLMKILENPDSTRDEKIEAVANKLKEAIKVFDANEEAIKKCGLELALTHDTAELLEGTLMFLKELRNRFGGDYDGPLKSAKNAILLEMIQSPIMAAVTYGNEINGELGI